MAIEQTLTKQGEPDDDIYNVFLTADTAIQVKSDGEIVGPNAEGTLGIVLHGLNPETKTEKAVRIPRLLQSDRLLNFHVAEIGYYESSQAESCQSYPGVLAANEFIRLEHLTSFTKIPGHPEYGQCFIGFYLSPASPYKVCLVSEAHVWPKSFDDYLNSPKSQMQSTENVSGKLFTELSNKVQGKGQTFSRLLFLPEKSKNSNNEVGDNSLLESLSREDLNRLIARREIGGWWFNIPVAIYPWMTANLERLLTGYIDEDDSTGNPATSLRSWKLESWFELIELLTQGLKAIHGGGAIHGDPRPANIMTQIHSNAANIEPGRFQWIDIGLGYGAKFMLDDPKLGESGVTPPPLGGGRSTVFYAPERSESSEFEDADVVELVPINTESEATDDLSEENESEKVEGVPPLEVSKLKFSWKKQTHLNPIPLQLRDENNIPIRELGKLYKRDRVQVREFMFEVNDVDNDGVVISRIYELFLDRLLIEKTDLGREGLHARLNKAAISRYRIFKQWGQATDIYGLGIITLYFFFVRGLYKVKSASVSGADRNTKYDRSNRESIFEELAALLRNRSFLETFISNLKLGHADLLNRKFHDANSIAAREISDLILATDRNFEFVWHGLEGNDGLFVQIIYFCLCCVWRQNEVAEMGLNGVEETGLKEVEETGLNQVEEIAQTAFHFRPFCKHRLMIKRAASPDEPAGRALDVIRSITQGLVDVVGNDGVPRYFREGDFKDPITLATNLKQGSDVLSSYLFSRFTSDTQQLIRVSVESGFLSEPLLRQALTREFNRLLSSPDFFDNPQFPQQILTEFRKELNQASSGENGTRRIRVLLEMFYSDEIAKGHALGRSRTDQIITLGEDLRDANNRIEKAKKDFGRIQDMSTKNQLSEHETLVLLGYKKGYVNRLLVEVAKLAQDGIKDLGRKNAGKHSNSKSAQP